MFSNVRQASDCSNTDVIAYCRENRNADLRLQGRGHLSSFHDQLHRGLPVFRWSFYESTGLKGHSQVLVYEPKTGTVKQSADIPPQFFGEGIVDWGPNLYEWTWQTNVGFVRDRTTLKVLRRFTYSGEGWGMTHTDRELVTSDGSSTLIFRDPVTFKETHHIVVKDAGTEISQLNELEFVKGEIYANVWHSDRLARISPKNGNILGWVDLTNILSPIFKLDSEAVLNGIAYDAQHDRLFVTGKQWPSIFEIKLVPKK
nr:glutaminyl-peptide cyclotransferase [Acidipila sp. EB88]